jgi:hypothetical protein
MTRELDDDLDNFIAETKDIGYLGSEPKISHTFFLQCALHVTTAYKDHNQFRDAKLAGNMHQNKKDQLTTIYYMPSYPLQVGSEQT